MVSALTRLDAGTRGEIQKSPNQARGTQPDFERLDFTAPEALSARSFGPSSDVAQAAARKDLLVGFSPEKLANVKAIMTLPNGVTTIIISDPEQNLVEVKILGANGGEEQTLQITPGVTKPQELPVDAIAALSAFAKAQRAGQ